MSDRPTLPAWPRGLREELAAAYIGLSATALRTLAKTGEAPRAVQLTPGRIVWLREDLDAWLDRKAGKTAPSVGDEWLTA